MVSDRDILNFSAAQRKMLIDHVDGAVPINWNDNSGGVRRVLLSRKLLRGEPHTSTRPKRTVLTEEGRHALGVILGDCADTLVRAGLLGSEESPLQVLLRLQAERRPDSPLISANHGILSQKRAEGGLV